MHSLLRIKKSPTISEEEEKSLSPLWLSNARMISEEEVKEEEGFLFTCIL